MARNPPADMKLVLEPTFWLVLEGDREGEMGATGCDCADCVAVEADGKLRIRFRDLSAAVYESSQVQRLGGHDDLDELVRRFSRGEPMADLGLAGEHAVRWFVAMMLLREKQQEQIQQHLAESMERAFIAVNQPPLEERS